MCSDFTLEIHKGDKTIKEILDENVDFKGLDYAIDQNGESDDCVEWLTHNEDMVELSIKYPDVIFKLTSYGTCFQDTWIKYYKNGFVQNCPGTITFEPYNESKLRQ